MIMGFAEDDEVWQAYLATFRQRLQDFGWTDGRNIRFDYRFTGESTERMRIAAAEIVAIAPYVIFVSTNPVLSALSQVTRTIPTVFTWVSDWSAADTWQAWRVQRAISPDFTISSQRLAGNGLASSKKLRRR